MSKHYARTYLYDNKKMTVLLRKAARSAMVTGVAHTLGVGRNENKHTKEIRREDDGRYRTEGAESRSD